MIIFILLHYGRSHSGISSLPAVPLLSPVVPLSPVPGPVGVTGSTGVVGSLGVVVPLLSPVLPGSTVVPPLLLPVLPGSTVVPLLSPVLPGSVAVPGSVVVPLSPVPVCEPEEEWWFCGLAALLSYTWPVDEDTEPSELTDMMSRSRIVNVSTNGLSSLLTRSKSSCAFGTT